MGSLTFCPFEFLSTFVEKIPSVRADSQWESSIERREKQNYTWKQSFRWLEILPVLSYSCYSVCAARLLRKAVVAVVREQRFLENKG